jgi:hypothetical protein
MAFRQGVVALMMVGYNNVKSVFVRGLDLAIFDMPQSTVIRSFACRLYS